MFTDCKLEVIKAKHKNKGIFKAQVLQVQYKDRAENILPLHSLQILYKNQNTVGDMEILRRFVRYDWRVTE